MTQLLSAAGRAFLRTFGASMLVLATGILAAPNLNKAYALGVAALLSSIAAGIRALQAFVPMLSFAAYFGKPLGAWVDAFVQAFVASLLVTLPGVLGAPDLATGRSLGLAAIVGALTAAAHALQDLLTPGSRPAPSSGIAPPPNP